MKNALYIQSLQRLRDLLLGVDLSWSDLLFHLAALDLHLVQDRQAEHLQIVLFQFILGGGRFTLRWVKGATRSPNDSLISPWI